MLTSEISKKCQKFTPYNKVIDLLDFINYRDHLHGKKILENACGDGQILIQIVKRYIDDCLNNGFNKTLIKEGLENDIYGFEIDSVHYQTCRKQLDNIAKQYEIYNINWNLKNEDYLKSKTSNCFDYIIGNPPYINYRSLNTEIRHYIRKNFHTCSEGKFDYCYAFIEASIENLKDGGLMAYLIPNSIFKTVFGKKLRTLILNHLESIIDFTSEKLFTNALTSSAFIKLKKNTLMPYINYNDVVTQRSHKITKKKLGNKWTFKANVINNETYKFSDFFRTAHSVATLLNKVFIFRPISENEDYFFLQNGFMIEKSICKPAASPRHMSINQPEHIIFPYKIKNFTMQQYTEEEMQRLFEKTYQYLSHYKDKLLQRDSDKSANWFSYGRSQAIAKLNQPKLLTSSVVTKNVKVYELDSYSIPYAGIFITPIKNFGLSVAKKILSSDVFFEYIQNIGINASGVSLRITSKDINNFGFNEIFLNNIVHGVDHTSF